MLFNFHVYDGETSVRFDTVRATCWDDAYAIAIKKHSTNIAVLCAVRGAPRHAGGK